MIGRVVQYAALSLLGAVLLLLSRGLIEPSIKVVVRRGKTRSSAAPARLAGGDTCKA